MASERERVIADIAEQLKRTIPPGGMLPLEAAVEAGYKSGLEDAAKAARERFDIIDRDAQTYSLAHKDQKAFALNQQRVGAMEILRDVRALIGEKP